VKKRRTMLRTTRCGYGVHGVHPGSGRDGFAHGALTGEWTGEVFPAGKGCACRENKLPAIDESPGGARRAFDLPREESEDGEPAAAPSRPARAGAISMSAFLLTRRRVKPGALPVCAIRTRRRKGRAERRSCGRSDTSMASAGADGAAAWLAEASCANTCLHAVPAPAFGGGGQVEFGRGAPFPWRTKASETEAELHPIDRGPVGARRTRPPWRSSFPGGGWLLGREGWRDCPTRKIAPGGAGVPIGNRDVAPGAAGRKEADARLGARREGERLRWGVPGRPGFGSRRVFFFFPGGRTSWTPVARPPRSAALRILAEMRLRRGPGSGSSGGGICGRDLEYHRAQDCLPGRAGDA